MTNPSTSAVGGPKISCSVVILTLNEELNLGACLQSLIGFTDVHVLDSGSTDRTLSIASDHGASVAANNFESFGKQRNWAHDHVALAHRWVLHLDADERMTDALRAEIELTLRQDAGMVAGYFIAERTLLQGHWLRHAGQYPRFQARLVHRDRMRFVDHGHGQREHSALPFGHLHQPYDHHAFSHGMEHWLRKHAGYAMREAEIASTTGGAIGGLVAAALAGPAIERRRALKALSTRVPMRPLLRWLYVMLVCKGVLDGRAGWQYARMMKVFQQMIDLCEDECDATSGRQVAIARHEALIRMQRNHEKN